MASTKRKRMLMKMQKIPCKVCGDKSSGIHYGLIACPGCKSFFRRNNQKVTQFQCIGNNNCAVSGRKRTKCQYCRLQKCIKKGMSINSIKFGRRNQEQRDIIEEELKFQKIQREKITFPMSDSETIAAAYSRTCFISMNHIDKSNLFTKLDYYKNLSHEKLWLASARKLTAVIEVIIEFAKLIPSFMKLSIDDQIILMKGACFKLVVLRMSFDFDLSRNCVLFGGTLLPLEVFLTTEELDIQLVTSVFDFLRKIKQLNLTETELALFSAVVLLSDELPGLTGTVEINRIWQELVLSLRLEMSKNHSLPCYSETIVFDYLMTQISALRKLSKYYMAALAKFQRSNPLLDFPILHKELFSDLS